VKAAKEIETTPALSRLVLILEHAPLGTMDRFLRTSPGLVGKRLWERWAVQTTEALSWVHGKGIVHADIKAGNLLVRLDLTPSGSS
jgi:serine/threonine protein kinase